MRAVAGAVPGMQALATAIWGVSSGEVLENPVAHSPLVCHHWLNRQTCGGFGLAAPPRMPEGPELFFGLVGAVGTDISAAAAQLTLELHRVDYQAKVIRL